MIELELQKTRLEQKIAGLPDGGAKDRAKLHLAEVEAALQKDKEKSVSPQPKAQKDS